MELSPEIKRALEKCGFESPTRIQIEAIPPLMQWQDVIAKAPTGTGKTFAFGIPIIEHIDPEATQIQALILAPTRELVLQICDELRILLEFKKGIRVTAIYGGQRMDTQIKSLKRKPQIIVATPGRLIDHMKRKLVDLSGVQTIVLDEADRMLDMGFVKEVTWIIEKTNNRKNMALLSATISQEVMTISWKYQRDEVEITVPADEENKPDIKQYAIPANGFEKISTTLKLIALIENQKAIIFCNTKTMVTRLTGELKGKGFSVDCIHGDIRQSLREQVMNRFKSGQLQVLVATDVASRGIDVLEVDCVINYDIPEENEYYVHRIGRTGRAKNSGVAYSLLGNITEKAKLEELAVYCKFTIEFVRFNDQGVLEPVPERKVQRPPRRRF